MAHALMANIIYRNTCVDKVKTHRPYPTSSFACFLNVVLHKQFALVLYGCNMLKYLYRYKGQSGQNFDFLQADNHDCYDIIQDCKIFENTLALS